MRLPLSSARPCHSSAHVSWRAARNRSHADLLWLQLLRLQVKPRLQVKLLLRLRAAATAAAAFRHLHLSRLARHACLRCNCAPPDVVLTCWLPRHQLKLISLQVVDESTAQRCPVPAP